MLKFSICSGVWILTILLFVASVTRTKNHNIANAVDYSLCHYHHNYCHRYRGQLKTANYFSSKPTFLRIFVNTSLNDTCLYDTLSFTELFESNSNPKDTSNELDSLQISPKNEIKIRSAYSEDTSIPNSFLNTVNDPYHPETRLTVASNTTLSAFQRESDKRLWKRRTLCSVFNDEKYSAETAFQSDVSNDIDKKESAGERKTLSDYDGLFLMNNMEDSDSLKPHVRVKRSELESSPHSFAYQQDYLKDLANSFPRNSYESIDENSYDDDASFDAKREIKSQEYFANDEESVGSITNDRPKISNNDYPPLLSSLRSGKCVANIPPNDNKVNKFVDKNVDTNQVENQEILLEEPLKKSVSIVNQRAQNLDSDASSFPEDPMLAVELVRKKRDDYRKARSKENLDEKDLSLSSQNDGLIDPLPSGTNQKNLLESNDKKDESCKQVNQLVGAQKLKRSSNEHKKPSSLVIADLKADLLRFKRRAKHERREKNSKSKKKRKHVEKKHDTAKGDSSRSRKTVRTKNAIRSRSARERKSSETRDDGKSKVRIARVVSKRNNQNNFRRRSVKAKKSIETPDSVNDRSLIRVRLKKIGENVVDDSSALSLAAQAGSDSNGVKVDENGDALVRNQNQPTFLESEGSIKEGTKLRLKRDKNAEATHGFLNEEDELRYYENIREPEPQKAQCANRGKSSWSSEGNEAESVRAARSIEEVKELAKKLVTKVNELENYLSVDEVKGSSEGKRIEARAIDDLCSNVTPTSAVLRETPKIIQRCVPLRATSRELTSTTKTVVERKVEPGGSVNKAKRSRAKSGKSVEKKRSARKRVVRTSSSTSRTVRRENAKEGRKWGRWTDWSSCSVTCGKGRQIRWRYCLHDCSTAETEMEEKACQLPACPPGKFLGIF